MPSYRTHAALALAAVVLGAAAGVEWQLHRPFPERALLEVEGEWERFEPISSTMAPIRPIDAGRTWVAPPRVILRRANGTRLTVFVTPDVDAGGGFMLLFRAPSVVQWTRARWRNGGRFEIAPYSVTSGGDPTDGWTRFEIAHAH